MATSIIVPLWSGQAPENRQQLLQWHNSIKPLKVDIVGDFAGKELFAIHGEAMLAHCVREAKVDFNDGFQLLHAVHAVETFLGKLAERGCNFHVLWFDKYEHLCIPRGVSMDHAYKYRLTRAVLIQHLANPSNLGEGKSPCSYQFQSLDCDLYQSYLAHNAILFIMCSHGEATKSEQDPISLENLSIGYQVARAGYCVAFINDIDFQSSKAYISICTPVGDLTADDEDEDSAEQTLVASEEAETEESSDSLSDENDSDTDDAESVFSDDESASSVSDGHGEIADATSLPFDGNDEDSEMSLNDVIPTPDNISSTKKELSNLSAILGDGSLSAREIVTLYALSKVLKSGQGQSAKRSAVQLVHLVTLRHCKISQRSFADTTMKLGAHHDAFMRKFSSAASCALSGWFEGDFASTTWDAYDLFDGRVYLQISLGYAGLTLPEHMQGEVTRLAGILKSLSDVDVTGHLPKSRPSTMASTGKGKGNMGGTHQQKPHHGNQLSPVLPFTHPVMDEYLEPVKVKTADLSELPKAPKIFQELTHWHNSKKPLDPKYIPKPPGFFQRKRNQKFMADTIAYSASLSGSAGKIIDPEIIVVQNQTLEKKPKAQAPANSGQDWKAALKEKSASKTKKPAATKKQPAKSGKQKALEAAEALRAEKTEEKSTAVVAFWAKRCGEFEKETSLTKRYAKARRYLLEVSSMHATAVGSEVSLYLCHVLTLLRNSKNESNRSVPDILAMLWSQAIDTQRFPMTQEIAGQLLLVAKALDIPISTPSSLPSRKLPFSSAIGKSKLALPSGMGSMDFQMNYCGPYLERSFDSAPDPRVPFYPDAWQRKVLDAIDDDKSLFVVAPTSAGKTFISFYAMKKVLQASNDDVLVYVAPTKALVNQIAAEIQARFSKSYHSEGQEGKSIWAIHTRDYRVNNPHKCQILVTVPHVLQIMLLSPSNASKAGSWARRVKRIIFDEVHCIGQAEDGVIWEQLLLLAPCPIIALSATVGNPIEFKQWLEGAARVKGFDFEMVVHGSRYSDLRKFIYDARPPTEFKGLTPVERLPFPGLDSGDGDITRFAFIHPIGSLIAKNLDTLKDVSLEPRDCLSLWQCMVKHQTDRYPIDEALHPKNFFSKLVKKSDVIHWEEALKKQLGAWMIDPASPFDAIRDELRGDQYQQLVSKQSEKPQSKYAGKARDAYDMSEFNLILDLRSNGALPAIIFNYDRYGCERSLAGLLGTLEETEAEYRKNSSEWAAKVAEFEKWKKSREKAKFKPPKATRKGKGDDDEGNSRLDLAREEANRDTSPWESFDPDAPLAEFSLADMTKISKEELESHLNSLKWQRCKPELLNALRRGLGVHHAGMNRQYRQAVEMLFRKGYLTVVVATGTLALGLNMPCKTVIFSGDSVFLSALNYRQASGRAGRRGFDLLGNIVFHGIPPHRSLEIMSARLPDLRGQFPTSVTLILRLFTLLHGTDNSEYAARAVKSLLTQTQLYLGGPEAQRSIQHHLRFSIEYLQRQHLLSERGVPLGLSGLVGHLYFTENSAFAFHALLNNGYFHKLCAKISNPAKQTHILREIVLTLSHLFVRLPVVRYRDKKWLEEVVHRSPSMVILPDLPKRASRILKKHNKETLGIFQGYVSTYASQHLSNAPDNQLPFTKCRVESDQTDANLSAMLRSQPETLVRSPFAALSGLADDFKTVHELCQTVRAGVFLDESAIPYTPVTDQERGGVPWNAYLYDFFKHGDLQALIRDNGIKGGDVWFHLKDFSLVLATIVASLANFLDPDNEDNGDAMIDVQDVGDELDETAAAKDDAPGTDAAPVVADVPVATAKPKKKKKAVDSWEDEEESNDDEASATPAADSIPTWSPDATGESLVNVHQAFVLLQQEFDTKFRKIWA
ncbi:P-loop containing nucleoside triphosphate hydrolase protein [Coniochaeta ligniaria NRRL 30616]|uniref:p-loop containing nucleoside triphosphate hydrolase protein n=1 Tax=Coniochaeta ligniaria NRRL 30616 TaxID=1408157 RepID=A0A1J7IP56_9PEZI|nr:P-loop containing nucleoside triphosphate hydrolase protein [Coniochaeta ligniaria NRRL 30616]